MNERKPAVTVPAKNPPENNEKAAATFFIHGLGDDALSFEAVAQQFLKMDKLNHMRWVIPNALENRDAMEAAWYTPSRLSAQPPSRPELAEDEDEDGMMQSLKYIESLIDDLVAEGIPANRIVVGGFSQGCAMALLLALVSSKYAGKLGGIYGIAGYLPLPDRIAELRQDASLPEKVDDNVPILITRGEKDYLVPKRYYRDAHEKLKEMGVKGQNLVLHEYPNVGHSLNSSILQDLCIFLEKVVPPI